MDIFPCKPTSQTNVGALLRPIVIRSIWLEGWKSERIENGERMEKWEYRKDFN